MQENWEFVDVRIFVPHYHETVSKLGSILVAPFQS